MNLNNIKMYRCACGCSVDRAGIMRSMRNSKFIYRCKEHKNGVVTSKYGICEDCDEEFNIPLSRTTNPTRCQPCSDVRHNDNQKSAKMRKWDCKYYEDCLYDKPKAVKFDCDKCTEYIHTHLVIDLSITGDQNVDDYNTIPKGNSGSRN